MNEDNYIEGKKKYPLIKLKSHINDRQIGYVRIRKEETKQVKKQLAEYKEVEKQLEKEKQEDLLKRYLKNFYQNPFHYFEYLIDKHFKEQAKLDDNKKLKGKIIEDLNYNWQKLFGDLNKFTNKAEENLKQLEMNRENQLRNMGITNNNNKINEVERGPVNFMHFMLGQPKVNDDSKENRFIVHSRQEINQLGDDPNEYQLEMIKEASQCLKGDNIKAPTYQLEMIKGALQCLKGDNIKAPTNKFLACEDLDKDYIDNTPMLNSVNIDRLSELKSGNHLGYNQNKKTYLQLNKQIINNDIVREAPQEPTKTNELLDRLKLELKEQLEKQAYIENAKVSLSTMSIRNDGVERLVKDYDQQNKGYSYGLDVDEFEKEMDNDYNTIQQNIKRFLKGTNPKKVNNTKIVTTTKLYKQSSNTKQKAKSRPKQTQQKEWTNNWNSNIENEKAKSEALIERAKNRSVNRRKVSFRPQTAILSDNKGLPSHIINNTIFVDINKIDDDERFEQIEEKTVKLKKDGERKVVNKFKQSKY